MTRDPAAMVSEAFRDGFHAHLDECRQCEEHPFDLCEVGATLLKCAVGTGREDLAKKMSELVKS